MSETNGFLGRFQKTYGRESAKKALQAQVETVGTNLRAVEAYFVGLQYCGKTETPEGKSVALAIQDGQEKIDGLKRALADIEAEEVAEKVAK